METVKLVKTIQQQFWNQEKQFGLLFGYSVSQTESHVISCAAPANFQNFGNDQLIDTAKEQIFNLLEDLHNAVNGCSLIGFIAKESDKIDPAALRMKAQEFYVTIAKLLKLKGSFFLLTLSSETAAEIYEKKQGQQFTKISFGELDEKELVSINVLGQLDVRKVMSEAQAQEQLITATITQEAQAYLAQISESTPIIINNVLIIEEKQPLSALFHNKEVSLQFIAQSNSEEEKYFKNPFEFKLKGQISSFFKVHGSLSIATLRNIAAAGIRKELEARLYQVFGEQFQSTSLGSLSTNATLVQLPQKFTTLALKNAAMSLFVSHPILIADIGSCIFESLSQVQQFLVSEFGWKDAGLTQTDALKINDSPASKSSTSSKAIQKLDAIQEAKDGSSVDTSSSTKNSANKNKQGIAILLFSAAMIAMAYIFMML